VLSFVGFHADSTPSLPLKVIVLISPVIHLQLVIERHPTLPTPGGFEKYRLHFITAAALGAFQTVICRWRIDKVWCSYVHLVHFISASNINLHWK
jgi:hypothetical protein